MGLKQSTAYCQNCQRQSLVQKQTPNHVLHLVLSIVTLGLWIFVWIILTLVAANRPPRCANCGLPPGGVGVMGSQQVAPPAPAPQTQARVDVTELPPEKPR